VKADAEVLEPWGPIDAAADDASGDCATSDGTAAGSVEVAVAGGAGSVEVAVAGEGLVRLTAHGIGGHASKPAGTLNAIGVLVDYLLDHDLCDEAERRFLEFEELVFASTDGSSLGIDAADEAFGPLTCIGGVVRTVEGRFEQTIDVRYPTTIDGARIERTLVFLAVAHRCAFAIDHDMAPFYSDPSAPDIRVLTACYCEYAQREAEPYTIGGGTYARHFAHAASFGPVDPTLPSPEWVGSEHAPDEGIEEEQLKRALKIYILAIARLMRIER